MAELVRDLGQYLIENNIAVGFGNDLFLNYTPDEVDDVVVLNEYSGGPSILGNASLLRRVQVFVRNKDYQQANVKIWSIYNLFVKEDIFIFHINDRYLIPNALQTPVPLMVDDKERQVFVFNLSFTTQKDYY